MKKMILATLVAMIGLTAAAQQAQEIPYIQVQGVATRKVEPNRIEISITLNEAQSKGKVKLATMEESLAKALKQAGVDASKQLVLVSQSSAAQKRSGAYQFKSFLLTLNSAAEVGATFDAFAKEDVKDANIVRTYHSDQRQIASELQLEAMKNSKEVALNLTSAIGQTIGEAIQIQFWDNSVMPVYNNARPMFKAAAMDSDISAAGAEAALDDLQLKPLQLNVTVTVRYLLPQIGK